MTVETAKKMLDDLQSFLEQLPVNTPAPTTPERQVSERDRSFVLAVLADEPMPISLLQPWASYGKFRLWRQSGKLRVYKLNGKLCVRPRDFFPFFRSLEEQETTTKPRKSVHA